MHIPWIGTRKKKCVNLYADVLEYVQAMDLRSLLYCRSLYISKFSLERDSVGGGKGGFR